MELTVSELLSIMERVQGLAERECTDGCECGGSLPEGVPNALTWCSVHEIAYPHSKYEKCPLCTEMAYSLCIEPLSGGVPYWQCTCGYKPISFVCPKCGKTQH